ncbi:3-oxoacyl-[acyl-carrier-protein] synthase II [Actinacidiphila rubida]|uniref:3-oxoacyl-[acyl-carrier-protein] synthase II n=3 Tax=Actinacidiphila rubida TaxID=310780 RepID=A0A1H8LL75_9ACTN|nr:3-oxoacyl-[acyl-carrier-protein] synthase II [Actinacidiphila rubida]
MGAVASVGADPGRIFEALCAGRDGRAPLRVFDPSAYRMRYAYEIDDRPEPGRDEPGRASRWLGDAVAQALRDADVDPGSAEVPVLVGTTLREQRSAELWWRDGTPFAPRDLHFDAALRSRIPGASSFTFANACCAALYSLALAGDLIELGLADTVVAAGTDSLSESTYGMLDRVQNETPTAARPFDVGRKGMVMGEGAVAVVLRRTGTGSGRVHARLRGVGVNCDAFHATAPDPAGIARVIADAHRRAGVGADDIDLVMLHGTGTQLNDQTEAEVLGALFAGGANRPLMTAVKSMTGHTLGGSGLLSLVVAVLAMRHGRVPPVHGLDRPVPAADGLHLVRHRAATADITTAQVNAFGFGGINAVAVVEAA